MLTRLFYSVYATSQVFLGIALLLGVSAEEKAKAEEKKPIVEAEAPKPASKPEDDGSKKDKRGLFDHDFGGHDFSHSHSYSNIDFGHHHEEPHHYEPHHHVHEEKTLTIVKKVPYGVPHVKEVHVPHVKEVS